MKAFLLAAGEGTRLRPITNRIPKCMVPIRGVPMLSIWLRICEAVGIDEILINVHAHADAVRQFLDRAGGGVRTRVAEEEASLRQAGARIGLATSASHKRTHATIAELGLTHYFDAIVTGDEVACSKPDPSIYRLAAEHLQEAPQNLVAIEDALAGVQAATTAGIRCIGIASGAKAEILRSAGADPVVSHFQQLSLPTLQERFSIERHSISASAEPEHGRSQ